MRICLLIPLLGLLSGCALLDAPPPAPRLPAPGSTLVLHRSLDVPVGMARAHIQNGRAVAESALDEFHGYCQFQTRDLSTAEHPLAIQADRFRIARAWLTRHSVDAGAHLFAGLHLTEFDDASPSKVTLGNEMELQSARQPGVYRLSCRYWADPYDPHLSLAEMRGVLGELVSIEP